MNFLVKNVLCPRCQGEHPEMIFRRMTHPVDCDRGYNYWASCPINGEPVLCKITDEVVIVVERID